MGKSILRSSMHHSAFSNKISLCQLALEHRSKGGQPTQHSLTLSSTTNTHFPFAGWIQSGGAWITHICFVLALKWSFSVVSDSLIRGFITLDRKAYLSITTDLSLLDCLV